jgi:AsmA protein
MSADNQSVLTQLKGEGLIQQGVARPVISATALCTQFNGDGSYDVPAAAVDYHLGITFPSADENKTCADINPRLKDIAWPVVCKGALADDPAKLCRADMEKIQAMLAKAATKEAGQKLEKKMDEALKKKFGEDSEQVKDLLKGLLH